MKSKTQRGQQTQSSRISQQSKSDHMVDRAKSERELGKKIDQKKRQDSAPKVR